MICKECEKNVDELNGRSVIVGKKKDGFDWIFFVSNVYVIGGNEV
jgi:hypothetical protein